MTINGYARLVGYDEKLQLVPDILDKFTIEDGRIFTLPLAQGPQMVGRPAVHDGGFPLRFRECDAERGPQSRWPADRVDVGGQAAEIRGHRRPHGAIRLRGRPIRTSCQRLPRRCRWRSLLPAHYLKQFHKKYPDQGKARRAGQDGQVQELAADAYPARPPVPAGEPRAADARSVDQHHRAAGRAVRLRAQSLFPPRRHRRPAAALCRPVRAQHQLDLSSSRPRPVPAKATCRRAISSSRTTHSSRKPRSATTIDVSAVGAHARLAGRAVARTSTTRIRCGGRSSTTCASAARCRSRSTGTRSTWRSFSASAGKAPTPSCRRARCSRRTTPRLGQLRSGGSQPPARRDGARQARRGGRTASCRTAGVAELIVETAGESTQRADVLELMRDHWKDIGIKLFPRSTQRDVFRSRAHCRPGDDRRSGPASTMAFRPPTWSPGRSRRPREAQLQWPLWGVYFVNRGAKGEAPDIARGQGAAGAARRLAPHRRSGTARGRSGRRCWRSTPTRCSRSARSTSTLQPVVRRSDAEERARQGALRLSIRPPISASTAGHLLVCTTERPDRCCATSSGASR